MNASYSKLFPDAILIRISIVVCLMVGERSQYVFSIVFCLFTVLVLCSGDNSLIAHWSFNNDPAGEVKDSESGFIGVVHKGQEKRVKGIDGQAIQFDGNYYFKIDTPDLHDITDSSFSWSAWYFPEEVPSEGPDEKGNHHGHHAILCKGGNPVLLSYRYRKQFRAVIIGPNPNENTVGVSEPCEPNNWYYIVQTVDDSKKLLKLYVNGKLVDAKPYEHSLVDYQDAALRIGMCKEPGEHHDNPAHGIIDEVKIFNYALDDDMIKTQYDEDMRKSSPSSTTAPTITSSPPAPSPSPTKKVAEPSPEKKAIGEVCGAHYECGTGNCRFVCCLAGNDCCIDNAQCDAGESCNGERFFCVPDVIPSSHTPDQPESLIDFFLHYRDIIELGVLIAGIIGGLFFFLHGETKRGKTDKSKEED